MAIYRTSVHTPRPPADAFAYLARFSNAQEWDPGVLSAIDVTPGPPAPGSTYRLVVLLAGRKIALDYRITEIDEPRRVVLQSDRAMLRSTDVIEVAAAPDGGSQVTYTATLVLKSVLALLNPVLGAGFKRIGDHAAAGLASTLAG